MSSRDFQQVKPFFSLLFIILTLFLVVFFKMEERRIGYSILKLNGEFKRVSEIRRNREIQRAQLSRPQRLDQMAQEKLTLKRAAASQIIYLSEIPRIANQSSSQGSQEVL